LVETSISRAEGERFEVSWLIWTKYNRKTTEKARKFWLQQKFIESLP
jgi:hypothetical protein